MTPSALFQPVTVNGLLLPNRIVMAPMSRHFSTDGLMPETYVDYYRRRAEGGAGLILSECTGVPHPTALRQPTYPRFYGGDALGVWRRVVEAVHEAGGRIFPQIWHAGLTREPGASPNPEATPSGPSGLFVPLDGQGRAPQRVAEPLTDPEIADIISAFGEAAGTAERLGFDGIEVHGAHGYLIDQFFWSGTNRRSDAWGGPGGAATRFAVELIRECRRRVAPEYPIFFRWSQWKQQDYAAVLAPDPAALEALLAPLVDAGVDLFHCSVRRFGEPAFPGEDMSLAGWTRKLTGRPVCTVGSIGLDVSLGGSDRASKDSISRPAYTARSASLDPLLEIVEKEKIDLVAIGRAMVTNPDLPHKVRLGKALAPYSPADLETLH